MDINTIYGARFEARNETDSSEEEEEAIAARLSAAADASAARVIASSRLQSCLKGMSVRRAVAALGIGIGPNGEGPHLVGPWGRGVQAAFESPSRSPPKERQALSPFYNPITGMPHPTHEEEEEEEEEEEAVQGDTAAVIISPTAFPIDAVNGPEASWPSREDATKRPSPLPPPPSTDSAPFGEDLAQEAYYYHIWTH